MRKMSNQAIPLKKRLSGFTLVETMMTVAVIGILAAIALPAYQEHVRSTNRAEAKGILLEMAQLLERNFTESNRYDLKSDATNFTLPITQSPKTGTAKYIIQFAAGMPTQNSYTLEAVPTGAMTNDACATLTLTHTGVKGVSTNASLTAMDCWQR
ncbi:type IV pilin protein [Nitrosomonas communis]|uniref:type IV pilin protein n=1 Tax=Nitrosomonas communis TaxID=44574 RepID=UPI0026F1687D|nr:type IV pilin protein [Nitrosomonas communis]